MVPNCPVCAISRRSIYGGQRSATMGLYTHGASGDVAVPGTVAYDDNAVSGADGGRNMVAYWLQNAGYHTGLFGKYLNGYPFGKGDTYVPLGWNDWWAFVDDASLGGAHATHIGPEFFNYFINQNGVLLSQFGSTDTWTTVGSDASGRTTTTDYSTDRIASRVKKHIEGSVSGVREPFFLAVPTYAVKQSGSTGPAKRHQRIVTDGVTTNGLTSVTSVTAAFTAADVGKQIVGNGIPAGATIASVTNSTTVVSSAASTATATGVSITIRIAYTDPGRPASFNEADVSDKPEWLREFKPSALTGGEQDALDVERIAKGRTSLAIDEMLRDIVAALTARTTSGVSGTWMDRTMIVVTTEHSNAEGEHRLDAKGTPYECCVTSPMFVHLPASGTRWNIMLFIVDDAVKDMWPSMPYLASLPTVTSDALVSTIDIAPTFLEVAGATRHATRPPDGQSFLPLLDGRISSSQWRQAVMSEWVENELFPEVPSWRSLRTPTRRYTEIDAHSGNTSPAETELYRLDVDPDEMVNETNNAAYAAEKAALANQLARLRAG